MHKSLIAAALVALVVLVVSAETYPTKYLRRVQASTGFESPGFASHAFVANAQPFRRDYCSQWYDEDVVADGIFIFGGMHDSFQVMQYQSSDSWLFNISREQWRLIDGEPYHANMGGVFGEEKFGNFEAGIHPGATIFPGSVVLQIDPLAADPFSRMNLYCTFGGYSFISERITAFDSDTFWCFDPLSLPADGSVAGLSWVLLSGHADPLGYTNPCDGSEQEPYSREFSILFHDSIATSTHSVYLYGGFGQCTYEQNDMYRLSLENDPLVSESGYGWTQVHANMAGFGQPPFSFNYSIDIWPESRYAPQTFWHRQNRMLFMYGGKSYYVSYADMWIYNMNLDPPQWRAIGGELYGMSVYPYDATPAFEFFTQDMSANSYFPFGPRDGALVYDAATDSILLVAGWDFSMGQVYDDIWAIKLTSLELEANTEVQMAYLMGNVSMVMDTYTNTQQALVYTEAYAAENTFGGRGNGAAFYVPSKAAIYYFGGSTTRQVPNLDGYDDQAHINFNDMWVYETPKALCNPSAIIAPVGYVTPIGAPATGYSRMSFGLQCADGYEGNGKTELGAKYPLAYGNGEGIAMCVNGAWVFSGCVAVPATTTGGAAMSMDALAGNPWFLSVLILLVIGIIALIVIAFAYIKRKPAGVHIGESEMSTLSH